MKRYAVLSLLWLCLLPAPAFAAARVQEVVSPGGFTAWLVEEHSLPLVAVKIAFRNSGSAYDTPGKEGLASMVAAMLLEGAGDMDSQAFNDDLDNYAIRLNFGNEEDEFLGSMQTLSEHKERAFSDMALALTKPRFDDSAIERVRMQSLAILKEEERKPGYLLQRQWETLAFGNHPYGKPSLGTQESLKAIESGDLHSFVRDYLSRENIVIAVTGDITPQELSALLDKYFSGLSKHYAPDVTLAKVRLPEEAKQVVIPSDIPQTMVLFGENSLMRADPRYYAAYVMNEILGGGGSLNSKLGQEIREKRGLAYGAGTQLEPMDYSALWIGSVATRNEKVGAAMQVLRQTLKSFAQNGPTDKELDDAKKHLVGSFLLRLDSNADIASFLLRMQLDHLGRDYLEKRNSLMMAVSKKDVQAMARLLLDPDKLLVVMVGQPDLETK